MKALTLTSLLFIAFSVISCSWENSLVGKKFYLLNASLDAITIAEYELNFISSDKVELTTTL